jgi:MFS family permease
MGVGIGEATLVPAAYSLLSDIFPRQQLGTALGIFSLGATLGVALSFGLGGVVLAFFSQSPGIHTPFGVLHPWQAAFVLAGTPGLAASVLALALPEPGRVRLVRTRASLINPLVALFRRQPIVLAAQLTGFSCNAVMGYSLMAWTPAFMGRIACPHPVCGTATIF